MNDVHDIFAYASDLEVTKLLEWGPDKSIDKTKEVVSSWLRNYGQAEGDAPWAIVDKQTNTAIGHSQYPPGGNPCMLFRGTWANLLISTIESGLIRGYAI